MAYVYIHTRLDTNKVFYVGIGSVDKYKRAYTYQGRNNYWKNIVAKVDYKVDIIFDNITWEKACKKEIRIIKLFGRKDLKLGFLVNMTNGGDGILNMKHSDKTKKIISLGLTKRHQLGLMPKRHKGEIIKSSKKVVILNLKSYITYSFGSLVLASIFTNRKPSEIRRTCLEKMRILGDYYIKFGDNFSTEEISHIKSNIGNYKDITDKTDMNIYKRKKIINTQTGEIFSSLTEAAKVNNLSITYLSNQLKGYRINKTTLKYKIT